MRFLPAFCALLVSLWFTVGALPAGVFIRELSDYSRSECVHLSLLSLAASALLVWLFLPPRSSATMGRRPPAPSAANPPAPAWPTAFSFANLPAKGNARSTIAYRARR